MSPVPPGVTWYPQLARMAEDRPELLVVELIRERGHGGRIRYAATSELQPNSTRFVGMGGTLWNASPV